MASCLNLSTLNAHSGPRSFCPRDKGAAKFLGGVLAHGARRRLSDVFERRLTARARLAGSPRHYWYGGQGKAACHTDRGSSQAEDADAAEVRRVEFYNALLALRDCILVGQIEGGMAPCGQIDRRALQQRTTPIPYCYGDAYRDG
jgi:hypothetical protein